jgi:Pyruvate/2-oxoacid:ferredoxin oxidoreductase delta subunit
MLRPVVDYLVCQSCQPCEARLVCNTRAIVKIDPDEPPYIATERCSGCSVCISACIFGAIQMRHAGAAVGGGCRGLIVP